MKIQNFGKPLSRLTIMVAICMLSLHAMAYDFSYTYQGTTLYYTITSSNTVQVANYNSVSGAVVIPSSVTNNGTTYSVTSIGDDAFYGCSGLTSVTIPNSVISIGWSAFSGCSGLTSITIPNSVISIGYRAFAECSSLTSVTIPNSVTSIGGGAFQGCSGLTSVTIPNSVTSIGEEAFYECSGLTSVTIPNSVISIGNSAFYECSGLTSVTIGNSVTSIGWSAFSGCSGLTSVTIGNSVTWIGVGAFSWCSGLTSVTIPNSVTFIDDYAFSWCSGLTSVTIGNSITSIGDRAFYWCSGLTSIVSNAVVPPVIGSDVFPYSNTCNVIVPCGSLEAYIASSWNNYFPSRITEVLSFDLSVAANDDSSGSVSVETQSCNVRTLTATPSSCKSFVAWNDGNSNNPRIVAITSDTSFTAIFESVEISNDITASICQGSAYTENGFNVSEAGVYTQNLQTINGCDSTVTLTLTVNPIATTALQASICEGTTYTENGFNVSEAGVYTQNLQTINGCDSTVTLTLTVNPVATTNLNAAICEGTAYTENGFNVNEAGVYTQNLQTINGCDSIVTLTLTVNPIATTTLQAAICEGTAYTENGFNVSEAGVYTQNLQTINGCDSTVTLTLTVNPIATTTLQAAICEGTTYTENGFNVSEAGVYTQNLQTINGCDSIVTLTLVVNPVATTTLQAAICQGEIYTENGFNVSEAGVYTQNLQTINGCDSTVTLTLIVNPVATTALQASICEGTTYTENGFNVSEAGVYTQNLQTINGCDSVVTLTLTVNPVYSF
ncbi:MAG: leucine-rich repeat domain-containing protein, partial [Bacteroidales bacterium]|nr:leucine-rich repeat domain-containing protein [Bacteroidales bacterium]